ncbi:30S ribosomal protein S6e [Candidatus Woesearchaeota archaeon]|nr:MAG: small subunit ribosomal protein S6e [archaeon GW2011_AR18]MBS3162026.1 30S ribosomal protein S6e [Candidatus Woesearchaeota archaeon]HIH25934.1 30S ribosomal protein S6e [Nanoarchaeota archaeon]
MAELKVVINDPKTGKAYQKVLPDNVFNNRKVGEQVNGSELELDGYELKITGGSDKSGCPIRPDMPGFGKKSALLSSGPCVHIPYRGMRKRKTVVGNLINADIVQLNMKVTKYGSKSLEEVMPKKEAAPAA